MYAGRPWTRAQRSRAGTRQTCRTSCACCFNCCGSRAKPVELEEHIENPTSLGDFRAYPKILADEQAVTLITDTLRSASLNYDDPYQVEKCCRSASA